GKDLAVEVDFHGGKYRHAAARGNNGLSLAARRARRAIIAAREPVASPSGEGKSDGAAVRFPLPGKASIGRRPAPRPRHRSVPVAMLERMKRLLACLLAILTGCASMPPWLDQTLASTNSQRLDPQIVAAAAADSDHIARIEAATRPPDPKNPGDRARNLSYLVIQLHAGSSDRGPYLALARRMYAIDPEHHGYTLAAVAEREPFDVCEAEVLRIAFDPRTTDSIGLRSSRHLAAASLVARLATDPGVPMLP